MLDIQILNSSVHSPSSDTFYRYVALYKVIEPNNNRLLLGYRACEETSRVGVYSALGFDRAYLRVMFGLCFTC